VWNNTTTGITLSFTLLSGNPVNYPIKCSIIDLPHGITCTNNSVEFKLSHQVQFQISVNADTGYYTANIKVSTPVETRFYPIKIYVRPPLPLPEPIDCITCLLRNWTCLGSCGGADSCHPVIDTIPGMDHWISIHNINCLGDSVAVTAYVACPDGDITIPIQTSNGYTIYGGRKDFPCGDWVAYTIPVTIIHNGDTAACLFFIKAYR
jgi:hypothetical protein